MTWTPTKLLGYKARLATTDAGVSTDIAAMQSGDFNSSVKMVDTTTVDDNGTDTFLPGTLTWGFSGKFALMPGDVTQEALMTAFLAKSPLTFTYFPVESTVSSGAPSYSGSCYVQDMKMSSGGTGGMQTLDITLKGVAAFTEVAQ